MLIYDEKDICRGATSSLEPPFSNHYKHPSKKIEEFQTLTTSDTWNGIINKT